MYSHTAGLSGNNCGRLAASVRLQRPRRHQQTTTDTRRKLGEARKSEGLAEVCLSELDVVPWLSRTFGGQVLAVVLAAGHDGEDVQQSEPGLQRGDVLGVLLQNCSGGNRKRGWVRVRRKFHRDAACVTTQYTQLST